MKNKYKYLIIVFLIVASFIAFGRTVGNDLVNFDDYQFITENIHIKSGFNAESIKWAFTATSPDFWHPLTWLSYMLEWSLFGANASGYHLVSLLWHIGSAILLFLLLSKTTGSLWPSAFVAALFALHPLRVESVAWAAERKDVLSVFFGMATLYAYTYYVEKPQVSKYIICLILFVLSLLSKPTLVTLPCVMLLLDYWPLGRWQKALNPIKILVSNNASSVKKKGKQLKANPIVDKKITKPVKGRRQLAGNLLWEKIPFFLLSLSLSIMLLGQLQNNRMMVSLKQISFPDRIMNALVSYVSYLGKTFWPVDLAVFYPYANSLPIWQVLGASLFLTGISVAVIYLAKKAPFLAVGWLWYLGVLFPVIGFMQAGDQSIADRYTYFPSIGIAIMLVWGVVYLLPKDKLQKIIIIPGAIILAALTFLTWQQCGYWKNSIYLFNHALQATKDNYLAHYSLGCAFAAENKHGEAIDQYLAAIKISPYYDSYYNLGISLAAIGRNEEAIERYLTAIKMNPDFAKAHYNLAIALQQRGKVDEAIKSYREAVRIKPEYSSAHINLGDLLEEQLKYDDALYHYRQALSTEPNEPGIYFNMGRVLIKKGNLKEAEEYFRQAIYLKPYYEDAHRGLRLVLDLARKQKR